jgi:hypothetical protein
MQVPGDGELATDVVNDVPLAGEVVAMLLHPDASLCAIDFEYGASVQPASWAVKVPLDPVPLVAYRSISGVAPFSGPVYTMGLSVGVNVAMPPVAPVALAVSVAVAIASPV